MDAFIGVTEFIRITATKEHDRKFLFHLKLSVGSWLVFDKATILITILPNGLLKKLVRESEDKGELF